MVEIGPEVEFQYGRRLFFQTRSRYISATNLYMMTIEVDEIWFVDKIDLLKARTSTNTKPEVVLSVRGSNFEKSIGRHISVVAVDPE